MLTYPELRLRLKIDKNSLDSDCAFQPELYDEAVQLASASQVKAKLAKLRCKELQAKKSVELRKGMPKPTDTAVKDLVTADPEVHAAEEEQIIAEEEFSNCSGLLTAFDQRRSMLNNEVSLWETQYYNSGDIKSAEARIAAKRRDHGTDTSPAPAPSPD